MADDDLRVTYLSLLLELLVLWYLLQVLAHLDQFGMKLVNLWLFCQLHQVCLIVGVVIERNWFVFAVGRSKTDVCLVIAVYLCLVWWSCQRLPSAGIMRNNLNGCLLRCLPCNLIWKLDGFAGLLLKLKAKWSCRNPKVNRVDLTKKYCH